MISYIVKMITLLVFSWYTIFMYYNIFNFHLESYSIWTIFSYLIPLFILYIIYKSLSLFVFNNEKNKIEISYTSMLIYAFIHLLLMCIIYFSMKSWFTWSQWIILFFKIIWFLFLPISIFSLSYGFWNKILSYIKWFDKEENTFKFLTSLGFWFFSFIVLIFIFGFFWFYNLYVIFWILITFWILWYKNIFNLYKDFFTKKAVFENNIYLYTSEFLFVIITALISANLILVFRPFPIWWDDLGVYMNTPNLLASAWKMLSLWWLQAWELYTWIWFLFWSSTQAFFLNTFSWIIWSIVLYKFIDSFLWKKNQFLNIALIIVAIFLAMPMTIFQLAKDMKLDIWLFSFSLISVYIIYYILIKKEKFVWETEESLDTNINLWFLKNSKRFIENYKYKKEYIKKESLYYIFIAWVLVWFAFTIKMTSLMLFSAILWLIIFNRIWFSAFLWYLAIYFWIFTKLQLWDMMNVVYPKSNIDFINIFSISSILIWALLILFSFIRHNKEYFLKTLYIILIFIAWFFIALSPWFAKNISETWIKNLTVWSIIWWKANTFIPEYDKIYSKEDLKLIEEKLKNRTNLDENWQAINADFWRYFWYEKWINNYLKLPFYLSMQKNQRWEFTDITYIFFALIPLLFLFIPLKNNWYYLWIYALLLFEILYFIVPWSSIVLTNIFSKLELPTWYAVILWFYLMILTFFKYATNRKNDNVLKLFIVNLSFSVFYVFLWNIAAFWIVWYGIVMYFCFFIFIWIWIYYIVNNEYKQKIVDFHILQTTTFFIVFLVISLYFVRSSIPHVFTNLWEDSYMHYKAWEIYWSELKEEDAIFVYHSDYLNVLYELNIKNEKKEEFLNKFKTKIINYLEEKSFPDNIKNIVKNIENIEELNSLLNYFYYWNNIEDYELKNEIWKIRTNIYNEIVFPSKEYKSDVIIYRIWTFLKYFITENNYRLFDDSLIFNFDDYIYNKDINITVDNFKKLGFSYILADLNTPTIDNDPKHTLTKRFENLLKTLTSDKVELVDTDSYCLKTGLEIYNKSSKTQKDLDDFIKTAWVNYESYDNEIVIDRRQKLLACYDKILEILDSKMLDKNNFSYLLPIYEDYKKQNLVSDNDKYNFLISRFQAWYKVLFKIK